VGNYAGALEALDAGVTTILDFSHCNNTPGARRRGDSRARRRWGPRDVRLRIFRAAPGRASLHEPRDATRRLPPGAPRARRS
jgi:hypothetical protein